MYQIRITPASILAWSLKAAETFLNGKEILPADLAPSELRSA
jgi:hypothetical protein